MRNALLATMVAMTIFFAGCASDGGKEGGGETSTTSATATGGSDSGTSTATSTSSTGGEGSITIQRAA